MDTCPKSPANSSLFVRVLVRVSGCLLFARKLGSRTRRTPGGPKKTKNNASGGMSRRGVKVLHTCTKLAGRDNRRLIRLVMSSAIVWSAQTDVLFFSKDDTYIYVQGTSTGGYVGLLNVFIVGLLVPSLIHQRFFFCQVCSHK